MVQGSGFNWPHPDHFRVVFLPHEDDLTEAIGAHCAVPRNYRKRAWHSDTGFTSLIRTE